MPERQVISNTSPLLYLHQVQRLEILRKLYDVVTIPKAVEQELAQGGRGDWGAYEAWGQGSTDRDPFTIEPSGLKDLKVLLTVVGGGGRCMRVS